MKRHPQATTAGTAGAIAGLAALVAVLLSLSAAAAQAAYVKTGQMNTGAFTQSGFDTQTGVAVDSATGDIFGSYWVQPDPDVGFVPGALEKFDATGSQGSPATMGSGFFRGVAVDPVTHNVYGLDALETAQIVTFDPAGNVVGTPFAVDPFDSTQFGNNPQIATDAAGNVYYPNQTDDTVEKFSPTGTLLQTFDGGAGLADPVSVALDSAGNLYVVDSGGAAVAKYGADGTLLDAEFIPAAAAESVAVSLTTGEIFVLEGRAGSAQTRVVRYDAAGVQLEIFGEHVIQDQPQEGATRIAVNPATGAVYVSEPPARIQVFEFVNPPGAVTGAASNVSGRAATLAAQVDPNGAAILACQIQYGTALYYGYSAPCSPNPGSGTDPVDVSVRVAGLQPQTTYHFRVRTTNGGGTVNGEDQTFTTLPDRPLVSTGGATAIGLTTATLSGSVNPNGFGIVASCEFRYGPTAAYGSTAPCDVNPVSGAFNTGVRASLSGLAAGTIYHYRLVASSVGGTAIGVDAILATRSHTCQTDARLCRPAGNPPEQPPRKKLKCRKGFKKVKVRGKTRCKKVTAKQRRSSRGGRNR